MPSRIALLAFALPIVAAASPVTVPHAGYLLGASDAPLEDGALALTFRIFSAESGGAAAWTGSCAVAVRQGYYAVTLGDGTCGGGLDSALLPSNPPNFLEVSVGAVALAPRLALASVPVASLAGNALAVGGLTLANLDARYAKVAAGASPSVGQVLEWNGTAWAPGIDDVASGTVTQVTAAAPLAVLTGTTTPAVSLPSATGSRDGYLSATDWARFDAKVSPTDSRLTDARTPTGAAGGDLGGAYPNPSVQKLRGAPIATTPPALNQVLEWNGLEWAPAADDAQPATLGSSLDFAHLEGGAATFAANAWTAVSFHTAAPAQGISVSGANLTFARAGKYQVSLTFRMDASCSDVWTGVRLFGAGADRGHGAGSGTLASGPATFVFLADVLNAATTYQLQVGRLNGACSVAAPPVIPDPTNGTPTTPAAVQATIVQLGGASLDIVANGAGRRWSDGTYARSCAEYRTPSAGKVYQGLTGDGVYSIDPDGTGGNAAFDAYCDMTSDAGGWTLLATLTTTNVTGVAGWPGWTDGWFAADHGTPTSLTATFSNHDFRKVRALVTSSLVLRLSNPVNAVRRYHAGLSQADWDLWNASRTVNTVNVIGPFNQANVTVSTSPSLTGAVASKANGHWYAGYFYVGTTAGGGDADGEGLGARYHVMSNAPPSYGYAGDARVNTPWHIWVK